MNLSSYLQMPPAPLVPNNTNNAVPQGARTGVGPAAGGGLGFDFAQVMARQMERLVPQERQTFAADVPEHPPVNDDTQDSRPAQEHHSTQRAGRETQRDAHTNSDASSEDADAPSQTRASPRSKPAVKANRSEVDALLEGLMQGAPVAPIAPAAVLTPVAAATTVANPDTTSARASTLQTVELSPQMRIITDPQKAPSPESLAAFAKSMGLDESAIQDLLAQQPATQASPLTGGASTDLTAGMPAPNAGMTLPTTMGASLNGALLGSAAGTPADSAVATQLAAMAASSAPQAAAAVSGAGLAAAATTLTAPTVPGLTPTDMAAIQQLQITVLPAAVLPVNTAAINTPTPSTIDMLSLLGTGVDEQDVSALLSRFTEDAGSESGSEQPASQGDGNNFSSFAQTLSRSNNAATTSAANAAPTAANMSEVYDQLSDKMATEMAARMHKQLSDGEWKMKFALRPSNLGGVEIQLEMKDGKLDAVFRADNPLTRDLLQNSSQRLREALGNFGINAGQVNVGQGGGSSPHSNSGNSGKNSQVRDNSSSQVNGSSSTSSATATRNKANASLLDLYA